MTVVGWGVFVDRYEHGMMKSLADPGRGGPIADETASASALGTHVVVGVASSKRDEKSNAPQTGSSLLSAPLGAQWSGGRWAVPMEQSPRKRKFRVLIFAEGGACLRAFSDVALTSRPGRKAVAGIA